MTLNDNKQIIASAFVIVTFRTISICTIEIALSLLAVSWMRVVLHLACLLLDVLLLIYCFIFFLSPPRRCAQEIQYTMEQDPRAYVKLSNFHVKPKRGRFKFVPSIISNRMMLYSRIRHGWNAALVLC